MTKFSKLLPNAFLNIKTKLEKTAQVVDYYPITSFSGNKKQMLCWELKPEVKQWLEDSNIEYSLLDIRSSSCNDNIILGGDSIFIGFDNSEDLLAFEIRFKGV